VHNLKKLTKLRCSPLCKYGNKNKKDISLLSLSLNILPLLKFRKITTHVVLIKFKNAKCNYNAFIFLFFKTYSKKFRTKKNS